MFEKYFKSILMSALGEFIEDFTDKDVKIDNWNGKVIKENLILKKTALMRLSKLIGLPLEVTDGYAQTLMVRIPWNRLWKEPIEILVENVYASCNVTAEYSQEFAEDMLLQYKDGIINKILENIKQNQEESKDEKKSSGLLYGYVKTILDNIKIKATNIHLRIEDMEASMKNKAFSFGFRCDLIEYSRVTKSGDENFDKNGEKAVIPKLTLNGLAVYWMTMDNYIIRPLNIKWLGTSVTITPLIVTVDINILNNFRALSKLMTYHNQNIENKLVYVNRPNYLEKVRGNAKKYWKFAITNVINIIRRKKANFDSIQKQYEMSKLQEMLLLESIYGMSMVSVKQYYYSKGTEPKLLIFEGTNHEKEFTDLEQLKQEIRRVKILLDEKKLAFCQDRANRRFAMIKQEIEEHENKRSKWTSWLPGFGKQYTNTTEESKEDNSDMFMDEQFEEAIDRYTEIINKKEEDMENDEILYHFTIALPLFELFLCNKKTPSSQPQVF